MYTASTKCIHTIYAYMSSGTSYLSPHTRSPLSLPHVSSFLEYFCDECLKSHSKRRKTKDHPVQLLKHVAEAGEVGDDGKGGKAACTVRRAIDYQDQPRTEDGESVEIGFVLVNDAGDAAKGNAGSGDT